MNIKLVDDYKKIIYSFSHNFDNQWEIISLIYRDLNVWLTNQKQGDGTTTWFGSNPSLIWGAEAYAEQKDAVRVNEIINYLLVDLNYGNNWHVIGSWRNKATNATGNHQPIIQKADKDIEIVQNQPFFIAGAPNKQKNDVSKRVLKHCDFLGAYTLTDDDRRAINKLYPNYCFNHLSKFESTSTATQRQYWRAYDFTFFPSNEKKINAKNLVDCSIKKKFLEFNISNDKYKDWLNTDKGIFFYENQKGMPENLQKCEELFDKNVLEIKSLVEEIGEMEDVVSNEQLNVALYDDSNIIEETFIQRVNKHLQLYGLISIPFSNRKDFNLINLDNLL